jgi:hypothetical protein
MPDRKDYPGIPAVTDERVLAPTVKALTEIVELLVGQRGAGDKMAATKAELDALAARVAALEP